MSRSSTSAVLWHSTIQTCTNISFSAADWRWGECENPKSQVLIDDRITQRRLRASTECKMKKETNESRSFRRSASHIHSCSIPPPQRHSSSLPFAAGIVSLSRRRIDCVEAIEASVFMIISSHAFHALLLRCVAIFVSRAWNRIFSMRRNTLTTSKRERET